MEVFEQLAALDFDHLVEVIPVAQTEQDSDLTFTVTSIERYQDGFIVHFLIEHTSDYIMSIYNMEGVDERGQQYRGRVVSGFGSGRPGGEQAQRLAHSFAPALNPEISELRFTVVEAERMRFDHEARQQLTEDAGRTWTVSITLRGRNG